MPEHQAAARFCQAKDFNVLPRSQWAGRRAHHYTPERGHVTTGRWRGEDGGAGTFFMMIVIYYSQWKDFSFIFQPMKELQFIPRQRSAQFAWNCEHTSPYAVVCMMLLWICYWLEWHVLLFATDRLYLCTTARAFTASHWSSSNSASLSFSTNAWVWTFHRPIWAIWISCQSRMPTLASVWIVCWHFVRPFHIFI